MNFSHSSNIKKKSETNPNVFNDNYAPYGMGWLLPLMLLVFIGGLILYFTNFQDNNLEEYFSYNENPIYTNSEATEITAVSATNIETSIKLNDSLLLHVNANGIEKKLLEFITSKKVMDSLSKNRWFDFDNLSFKAKSTVITDSGLQQIKNIAAILKTYPSVKIKIGGYTDKTGNEPENLKLSQARANAVFTAFLNTGVNQTQLSGAEGYGSRFAKANINAPDSLKEKDRRISINVTAK